MTANPTLLSMPLAQNGQKNVIPETQATAGDGLFSQSTGFPPETSLPLGAGGVEPKREDFNGMANLLGGVAFFAQKGFTFQYDATQDYYTGCIVIDSSDGLRYECIADMTAGTIAPHDDTTNTYWTIFKSGLDREQIPAFNKRDVITTSGTYTAPVDGWYKITVKGGGGGGSKGGGTNTTVSGAGGGEGGTSIAFEYINASDTATVVIGAGGIGATTNVSAGGNGGDSSVTVNANTYIGGGGNGASYSPAVSGLGGNGTIQGASGAGGTDLTGGSYGMYGGAGGGAGGGVACRGGAGGNGTQGGGGGGGGSLANGTAYDGGNGGDGFAWFEYFDGSLNP